MYERCDDYFFINETTISLLTFISVPCNPGANVIQAVTMTRRSITAYMSLVDVELAQEGHAEQQREHAVLPQQHAN